MPKISDKPIVRVQMRLFKEDYDKIVALSTPETSASKIIRTALHVFVNQNEARVRAAIDNLDESEHRANA